MNRLSGGVGTILAWVNGSPRAHVEVELWRRKDGFRSWGHSVKIQVARLKGVRAALALGLYD